MKKYFTLLLFTSLSTFAFSQLENNSIGPDFIVTDLEGNDHRLYDYLDDGKIVILDLFATWCGPCWSYHQAHTLADIYEEYGPNGTDEIMIIAIESDARTNIACLYGESNCSYTSIGDWVTGVPYPTVDNNSVADKYRLSYFPTIYMIYPNRRTVEMKSAPFEQVVEFKNNAPRLAQGINPIFVQNEMVSGSFCESSVETNPEFVLQNMGDETISSATVQFIVNGEVRYEEEWTGELKSYQVIDDLTLPSIEISENATLTFKIANINGGEKLLSYSTEVVLQTTNQITVTVNTDENSEADANSYIIRNSDTGQIVANVDLAQNNTTITNTHKLDAQGCYLFLIFDNGVNGIDGDITIIDDYDNLIYENKGFAGSDVSALNVQFMTNTIDLSSQYDLNLSPNPAIDVVNIHLNAPLEENFDVQVMDLSGKIVLTEQLNSLPGGRIGSTLNVANLEAGLYMITLSNDKGFLTQKLVVK